MRRRAYRSRQQLIAAPKPPKGETMSQTTYLWNPPPVYSVAVRGRSERYPIHRLFFVGRNYHAHAVEMGRPVDKSVEVPFYFTKSPSTLVESGATVAYPPGTKTTTTRWNWCWRSAPRAFASARRMRRR
jgi:2-keto-4-pentenoate hydratase/2-oxohepta-3-ene-1,7-dioic acid hydratase in catechol pathway